MSTLLDILLLGSLIAKIEFACGFQIYFLLYIKNNVLQLSFQFAIENVQALYFMMGYFMGQCYHESKTFPLFLILNYNILLNSNNIYYNLLTNPFI